MAHLYITKQTETWKTASKLYKSNETHNSLYADIYICDLQMLRATFVPSTFHLALCGAVSKHGVDDMNLFYGLPKLWRNEIPCIKNFTSIAN